MDPRSLSTCVRSSSCVPNVCHVTSHHITSYQPVLTYTLTSPPRSNSLSPSPRNGSVQRPSRPPHPLSLPHRTARPRPLRPPKRILRKSPCQRFLRGYLLAADKGVDGDCDGAIDVVVGAEVAESHFGE